MQTGNKDRNKKPGVSIQMYRTYVIPILGAVIMSIICLPRYCGLIMFFFIPFFALWLFIRIFKAYKKPEQRKPLLINSLIWLFAFSSIAAVHWNRTISSRQDADFVVSKVMEFKAKNGFYPANLAEAGLDTDHFKNEWEIWYNTKQGGPFLSYPLTFVPFNMYHYDFEKQKWVHIPD